MNHRHAAHIHSQNFHRPYAVSVLVEPSHKNSVTTPNDPRDPCRGAFCNVSRLGDKIALTAIGYFVAVCIGMVSVLILWADIIIIVAMILLGTVIDINFIGNWSALTL